MSVDETGLQGEDRARLDQNRKLFTSDLSVSEFALLHQLGYQPLGLVMGSCVYITAYATVPYNFEC